MEDKCLVNCGDFPGDFWTIRVIRLMFRCIEYEEGLFEVMNNILMPRWVLLFI